MEPSVHDLEHFKTAFQILAFDNDDRVTVKDLENALRALGRQPTEKELQLIISDVDYDGNGFVEYDAFVRLLIYRMSYPPDEDALRETFRIFDKDNTGFIGVAQIRLVMMDLNQHLTTEECEEMIRPHDEDGDGKLSYEEFVLMMTTK
ncbi:calmodulin [Drosophila grimshawi]|uniref:GH13759 n=1 Tax=Drosophila grimshawi TaxID=7222 RepID=B4JQU8_DROGR|nr:calmodulin [Drosophila grimshawi]XP_032595283.1 calmodulin [Drosophila grimshawi]EDV99278.1 GH13759 [Drosophila grimshawi]